MGRLCFWGRQWMRPCPPPCHHGVWSLWAMTTDATSLSALTLEATDLLVGGAVLTQHCALGAEPRRPRREAWLVPCTCFSPAKGW